MNTSEWSDDELTDSLLFGSTKSSTEPDLSFLDPPKSPTEIGRLGDFRILKVLGKGGMGIVFEAEDRALQRTVALKVLHPRMAADRDYRERFLREARAVAALNSDYVVTIHQVGVIGHTPFLTMQLLSGMTLQDRLEQQPPLELSTALVIARQIATGLADVHRSRLIHRDVKPANVWLESNGANGPFRRVRLLDFGLARRSGNEPGLTSTGTVIGTPWYMSPEQARGDPIDARADLFSLGCVMYLMLTGELAFPGESTMTVFAALANHTPPAATIKNPAVPESISNLVARLLSKDREDRPKSADELLEILEGTAIGETAVVTPAPTKPLVAVPTGGTDTQSIAKHDTHPDDGTGPHPKYATTANDARVHWRGKWAERIAGISLTLATIAFAVYLAYFRDRNAEPGGTVPVATSGEPIKVGVLHSRTGTMAVSELPILDATMLAIEELNRSGGVLGRRVQAVTADGKSDPDVFDDEAERLIVRENVVAIFGCQTSASRKAVRGVVERENGLLFFPASHEGLEESPRVVYVGAVANQKFLPSVDYVSEVLGKKRIFFVGSDLISPRIGLDLVKARLKARGSGAEIVGDAFFPLGSTNVAGAVEQIEVLKPDAIVNTVHGGSNHVFFRELRARGLRPADLPTMSVSMTEHEMRGIPDMAGDYLAASYFQSIDREENRVFLRKLRERYGADRVATDNMVHAYTAVHLWGKAAAKAGTPKAAAVVKAVRGIEYAGPGAIVRIDEENQHAWRPWRIGQVQPDGSVKVVAESPGNVRPEPFPDTRPKREWEQLLSEYYTGWGNRWQPPTKP
jgi:urea transport system substrate-binding protein